MTEPSSLPTTEHLDRCTLSPITTEDAGPLSRSIAAIDPWARMGYPAGRLEAFFCNPGPSAKIYLVTADSAKAGVIAISDPWLHGPYLQMLAILPGFQSQGIGTELLSWFEMNAQPQARNLWVIASEFNERAIAFYERLGFARAAIFDDLIETGYNEILLRKRL